MDCGPCKHSPAWLEHRSAPARPPACALLLLQEVRRGMWPEHARQPAFVEYLRQKYDPTQLEAIEVGCAGQCSAVEPAN